MWPGEIFFVFLLPSIAGATFIEFKPFDRDSTRRSSVSFFYADFYRDAFPPAVHDFADIEFPLKYNPCVVMNPSYPHVQDQMDLYATCDYEDIYRYKFTLNRTERKAFAHVSKMSTEFECIYKPMSQFEMSWDGINYTVRSEFSYSGIQQTYVRFLQYELGWNYDKIRTVYPIMARVNETKINQIKTKDCACLNSSSTENQMKIWHHECEGSGCRKVSDTLLLLIVSLLGFFKQTIY